MPINDFIGMMRIFTWEAKWSNWGACDFINKKIKVKITLCSTGVSKCFVTLSPLSPKATCKWQKKLSLKAHKVLFKERTSHSCK